MLTGVVLFGAALATLGSDYSVALLATWSGWHADTREQLYGDMSGTYASLLALGIDLMFLVGKGDRFVEENR